MRLLHAGPTPAASWLRAETFHGKMTYSGRWEESRRHSLARRGERKIIMGYVLEECVKSEHPDNYDAELLLRLYDLRRESKLRQGREWLLRRFQTKNFDDYLAQAPAGSENSALFRMTVTYWDMAASLVNRGLINVDLFFENTSEFWIIWDKVRNFAPPLP